MAQVRSADKLGLNNNIEMCKIMMSRSLDHSDDADSCADKGEDMACYLTVL